MNQKAIDLFEKGFSCSQSVFAAYAPIFGIDEKTALKISSAFGGGMSRLAHVCGAVSGAFMIIGLKAGGEDKESKERTYLFAREFAEQFKSLNGSIMCKDLLGYDISTSEGLQKAREANLFKTICPKYVRDSCQILEKMFCL
ncbi:C-GCAxxG-C-C family protein [Thermotoga profunda]|uniref:C-GCAxxG-C-C family protein n=1 Tax=Thermotoga profunda TaxID=1508420 RepID=UPI000597C611|nr:C-GCAxxG-C-C family protein [Thermotoga profunda]